MTVFKAVRTRAPKGTEALNERALEAGYALAAELSAAAGKHVLVEKPPARRAAAMVRSGKFLWNSGIFVLHARTFLDELARRKAVPTRLDLVEGLEQLRALENGHRIRVAEIEGWTSVPVDVPADVARVDPT